MLNAWAAVIALSRARAVFAVTAFSAAWSAYFSAAAHALAASWALTEVWAAWYVALATFNPNSASLVAWQSFSACWALAVAICTCSVVRSWVTFHHQANHRSSTRLLLRLIYSYQYIPCLGRPFKLDRPIVLVLQIVCKHQLCFL